MSPIFRGPVRRWLLPCLLVLGVTSSGWGYVEAPYTLGRICDESLHIVQVEVTRVNRERGLIIYKKIKDLKGEYPSEVMKHNIGTGQRGLDPREHKRIMAWAEVGKQALFFATEEACEMCLGDYWYQCYREEEWWGMEHGEPYLLRSYCGPIAPLPRHVLDILAGREVVVTSMADVNRERLHLGKGRMQRVKASLARHAYDVQRDFVGWGVDEREIIEYHTDVLLAEGSAGWRWLAAKELDGADDRWTKPDFNDHGWQKGTAPIGNVAEEITKRSGTKLEDAGKRLVFRREVQVPGAWLPRPDATFVLHIAACRAAKVYFNGELLLDDSAQDRDCQYWNHEIDLRPNQLRPGRNVIAIEVATTAENNELFCDARLDVETKLVRPAETARNTTGTTIK